MFECSETCRSTYDICNIIKMYMYIYTHTFTCCALVGPDNKLYEMHGMYDKIGKMVFY
jgi:hypothetical protein